MQPCIRKTLVIWRETQLVTRYGESDKARKSGILRRRMIDELLRVLPTELPGILRLIRLTIADAS